MACDDISPTNYFLLADGEESVDQEKAVWSDVTLNDGLSSESWRGWSITWIIRILFFAIYTFSLVLFMMEYKTFKLDQNDAWKSIHVNWKECSLSF